MKYAIQNFNFYNIINEIINRLYTYIKKRYINQFKRNIENSFKS